MSCTVSGCSRRVTARSLCPTHYQQWRRTGSVEVARAPGTPRVMVPWRLPDYLVEMCRQAAALESVEPGQWVEQALLAALPLEEMSE